MLYLRRWAVERVVVAGCLLLAQTVDAYEAEDVKAGLFHKQQAEGAAKAAGALVEGLDAHDVNDKGGNEK